MATKQTVSPEAIAFYSTHPVEWIEDVWLALTEKETKEQKPGRRLEWQQKVIANAVAGHKTTVVDKEKSIVTVEYNHPAYRNGRRTAVRSGHGIGKTFIEAALIGWFMHTRPHPTVMLTGPKFDQLKSTIWAELNRCLIRSHVADVFECTSEKMFHKGFDKTWFAEIITAKDAERISGYHNRHLFVDIDEGSGEAVDAIMPALLSCATQSDNLVLSAGNPTRTIGTFRDCFTSHQHLWTTLHFDSRESAIVDPLWLEDAAARWHPDSDMYRVRVKGDFPLGNPKSIITLSDCEAARTREVQAGDFLEFGVDPALEGNDLATVAIRQGMKLHEIRTMPKCTPLELYIFVIKAVKEWRAKTQITSKIKIKVDAHGGYGSHLISAVSLNSEDNLEVVPIYSNTKSTNKEYKNYGTEMWFEFGKLIHEVELPDDPWLVEELSSREWNTADLTAVAMEAKSDIKERLGRSPDRADACVLCFAGGPRRIFSRSGESSANVNGNDFEIDWDCQYARMPKVGQITMTNCLHLAGIALSDDLQLYGLAVVYKFYEDMLYVYGEYHEHSPIVDRFAPALSFETRSGIYMDQRRCRYIGNENMFRHSGEKRPMADVFRREGRINVLEPVRYDEYGAIGLGAQMFRNGRIAFHRKCEEARVQTETWTIGEGKSVGVEGGFCKSLLLVLSEIKRRKPEQMVSQPFPDYRRVDQPRTEITNVTANWMKR